jgi:hypothetical protein
VSGDQANPVVAEGEPSDRAFCERPDAIEFKRVEAWPVFDEATTWEAGRVSVVQSEARDHERENNTGVTLMQVP